MSDATVGRRPDGPGWYWYEGAPVEVAVSDDGKLWSAFKIYVKSRYKVGEMPGDFTPLSAPIAMPQPNITPEIMDAIEDAILIGDDDSIGAVWEWLEARRKEVRNE